MTLDAARRRARYWRRVYAAYVGGGTSQLTFWHERPAVNEAAFLPGSRQYYMTFRDKADYAVLDGAGVPVLDYRGTLGAQHNPIAIAQYGLANFNLDDAGPDDARRARWVAAADWLAGNLEPNARGVPVWMHHFDWEYRDTLQAPWYSGLAQGQGISLLVRAAKATDDDRYLKAADDAFESLTKPIDDGGALYVDRDADTWIEEYIVRPPTHILNGFIWALWGVHDYAVARESAAARTLFDAGVRTIARNLHRYDIGFWSLYEQSGTRLKMVASPFYHSLHVVQLRVMHRLTGDDAFARTADRWAAYRRSNVKRRAAYACKVAFKILHY